MNLKKIGKRLMSLLLTLCMVISCVPAPAVLAASDEAPPTGGGAPRPTPYSYQELEDAKINEIPVTLYPGDKIVPTETSQWERKLQIVYQEDKGNHAVDDIEVIKHFDISADNPAVIKTITDKGREFNEWEVFSIGTGYSEFDIVTELVLQGKPAKTPHSITTSSKDSTKGTIMVDGPTEAKEGDPVSLYISPESGYEFNRGASTVDPTDLVITKEPELNIYSFTMPDQAVTIDAAFTEATKYTIDIDHGDAYIGTDVTPVTKAAAGQAVDIEPRDRSDENLMFDRWAGSAEDIGLLERDVNLRFNWFTMPGRDVTTLRAEYVSAYHVKMNNGGKAFVDDGGQPYELKPTDVVKPDTTVTIEAPTDKAGKAFKEWRVNSGNVTPAEPTKNKTTFTMPGNDVELTAVYEGDVFTHKVTMNGGNAYKDRINVNGQQVEEGSRITIEPNNATLFKEWQVDGVTLDDPITTANNSFTMGDKDVTITARYKTVHNIDVTDDGHSTGASAQPPEAPEGTSVYLDAGEPKPGYVFDKWVVISGTVTLGSETSPGTTFTMPDEPVAVQATFKADDTEHSIKVTYDAAQGTATADRNTATAGTLVTLTAEPKTGFRFKEWQVISGGVDIDTTNNTFLMPAADVEIKAVFQADQGEEHNITVNYGRTDKDLAKQGDTVTITADEKEGKVFKNWTVDKGGVTLADANSRITSFTMPDQDVEVTANYEDIIVTEYTTYVTDDGHGEATAAPAKAVPGTAVTLSVSRVDDGYVFKEWQVVSGEVTIANNTFLMPASDVEIMAVFEQKAPVNFEDLTTNTPLSMGALIKNETPGALLAVRYLKADGTELAAKQEDFPYTIEQYDGISDWIVESKEGTGADCRLVLKEKQKITSGLTIDGGKAYNIDNQAITQATEGDLVSIEANTPPAGKVFDRWQVSDGVNLKDITAATTDFIMPAKAVSITALYKDAPVAEYTVTIKNDGNGTAKSDVTKAKAGDTVRLTATPKTGYVFKEWQIVKGKVVIKNNSFTMPAENVEIKAVFAKKSAPAPKPVDPTKPVNNGGAKNPVTGLDMSTTETSGFALVALSLLLLGTTAVYRRRKAR